MRTIHSDIIVENVKALCMKANYDLSKDVYEKLIEKVNTEVSEIGTEVLEKLIENADIAREERKPICQDTGMAVFFVEIGKDIWIDGLNLNDAINEGVRRGYKEGYLRKSVVSDPIIRENTNDNTPAIIYIKQVDGDKLKIDFAPKGFGSENMSQVKMLKPSDGIEGVYNFVIDVVREAKANPCPPIVIGVGIGGTMDQAAVLAKRALFMPIDYQSEISYVNDLQIKLYEAINNLGIGPAGMGGSTTMLGINVLTHPTHIAGLPVAVNINCHATRHASCII